MNVKCQTCKKIFPSDMSDTQALGCASEVILDENGKKVCYSHYGSLKYDMLKHNMTKDSQAQLGVICDDCITKEIKEGHAVEDKNYSWADSIVSIGAEIVN